MKTIYYYQTFVGLDQLLTHVQDIDVIIVSSIHFDKDKQGNKYIYLNDNKPNDPCFDTLWTDVQKAYSQGVCITLMIGGAGTAYQQLFLNYNVFYPLLKNTIEHYRSIIDGIDLDIEESTLLKNIKKLINDINSDFGDKFIITMAPVQFTMENPTEPGMSGFLYKSLFNSPEGQRMNYFNVQAYSTYSCNVLDTIIKNGYPVEKIVMGM